MIDFLSNCPPNLLFGAILLLINFPLGWIGLVWFAHRAKTTGNRTFYFSGIALYIASWFALIAGIFFCGKEYANEVFNRYHTPVIVLTALTVVSIFIISRYFSKTPQKSIKS